MTEYLKWGIIMKISFIVPVYKVEKYLNQCIDSILAQDIDDYEIILVDDESPDNCPQMCDDYQAKYPDIIKVIHNKHGNLAISRNTGFEISIGEYIFFFDSDDFCLNNDVKELLKIAAENKLDILQTSYTSLIEKSGETYNNLSKLPHNKVLSHSDIEKEFCNSSSKQLGIYVWRNIYRRQFLIENNIYFNGKFKALEDSPFNYQAFLTAERVMAVDIPVYCYRLREASLQRQFIPDYDVVLNDQWKLKVKYYEENCTPQKEFYSDLAKYTLKGMLPILFRNIYFFERDHKYSLLKRMGKSEMVRKSFKDYDINEYKSKSFDWIATKLIKHRLYLAAHIVCKYFWYK